MQGKLPGEYSQGQGLGPKQPQTSDGRPALKTTRSHNRAHRLQQEAPPASQWLAGASPSP